MKSIAITIDEDGHISTDLAGFQGTTCIHEAERLIEALSKMGVAVEITAFTAKKEAETALARTTERHRAND